MPQPPITQSQLDTLWEAHEMGLSIAEAAKYARTSERTARRYFDAEVRLLEQGADERQSLARGELTDLGVDDMRPKPRDELGPDALKALDDIGYFAHRYYGALVMPWQEEAAATIIDLKNTPNKEYACINVAPGSGKSYFFTQILPTWMICRDRRIRGLTGHASSREAEKAVDAMRRMLERTVPVQANSKDIALETARDADATLAGDFGRFKPMGHGAGMWTRAEISVAQIDDVPLHEKDRTWVAYGLGSTYVGVRVDVSVWDDAQDPRHQSPLTRDEIKREWDKVAEQRPNVGGILILQGQRIDSDDLYHHCISKQMHPDGPDVVVEDDDADDGLVPMYRHIVYRSHYEELCEGRHDRNAAPWPNGCLLDPKRLAWRDLRNIKLRNPSDYAVLYQQEDTGHADVLVRPTWVDGGIDPETGEDFLGCWDSERGVGEWPPLVGDTFSIATIDPSPTQWWAWQWWLYHPASEQRFLIDVHRAKMGANDVLDYNSDSQSYTGLMDEWQRRSVALGRPITSWIVERNGAQRFMLQYNHVKSWLRLNSTNIIPHETTSTKSDLKYGVTSLGAHWRYGRVRLPGRDLASRAVARLLVDEVTHYGVGGHVGARYDDQVMAEWFLEWNLPNLATPRASNTRYDRPSWASNLPQRGW